MEAISVGTVWPFFLVHGQQAYVMILFAIFAIAVLFGVMLVLLITETVAFWVGAQSRSTPRSNFRMHRCRIRR
jgi:hypothetical protein